MDFPNWEVIGGNIAQEIVEAFIKTEEQFGLGVKFIRVNFTDFVELAKHRRDEMGGFGKLVAGFTQKRVTLYNVQVFPERGHKVLTNTVGFYFSVSHSKFDAKRNEKACVMCCKRRGVFVIPSLWVNGFVQCDLGVIDKCGLQHIIDPPPKDCPFILEHLLEVQRVD